MLRYQIVAQKQELIPGAEFPAVRSRRLNVVIGQGEISEEPDTYLMKISMFVNGTEQPVCDVPFAIGIGHWLWIPPPSAGEED